MPTPTPVGPPSPPAHDAGLSYHYAGLIERFGAAMIDLVILLVFAAVLALPFGILTWSALDWTHGYGPWISLIWGPFAIVVFALWVLYYTYLESTSGQTFGKRAIGLKVVSVPSGKPPDWEHALVRNVVRIIDWLPLFYLVGFACAELTPRKQRLGDLLANTTVLHP